MKNTFQNVTWTDIERLTKLLSKKISMLSKDFSSISTISRGGLVPARLLADHMGIDVILVDKNNIPFDSLFVDDIFDSGDTFKKIISKVNDPSNFVYATLFARRGKIYPKQLVYAQKTKGNEYIVYPWDKLEYRRSQNSFP
ncbi:MAG: phosphoribosyltransferase [Nitrosarchaeum sp.]